MKLVIVESPYAGCVEDNTRYARQCLWDCLHRGESPFASHLLYTQVLDDLETDERWAGINAGMAWLRRADFVAAYTDRGISGGMAHGIQTARDNGIHVTFRSLKYPDTSDLVLGPVLVWRRGLRGPVAEKWESLSVGVNSATGKIDSRSILTSYPLSLADSNLTLRELAIKYPAPVSNLSQALEGEPNV